MGRQDGSIPHMAPSVPPPFLTGSGITTATRTGRQRQRGVPTIIMQAPLRTHHAPEKNKEPTPAERWELQQLALTRLYRVQAMQDPPKIWVDLAPLKKGKTCTALDITCLTQVQALRLKPPKITHSVAVLLLSLAFHTEDPNGVSDATYIFMFPDLSLLVGTEAALVVRQWDTVLDSNLLTSYADTAALMKKQRILKIVGSEGASKMLEQWLVLINVILGPPEPLRQFTSSAYW